MRRRHELRETLTQLKARKALSWIVCWNKGIWLWYGCTGDTVATTRIVGLQHRMIIRRL